MPSLPVTTLAVIWLLTTVAASTRTEQAGVTLQEQATRAIGANDYPFGARVDLVTRLERAQDAEADAETAGGLALLWLRGVRWLLAAVPMHEAERPPYRDWLAANDRLTQYSEPAGEWLIVPNVIWRVHDRHRTSGSAEAIAWLATENGLPSECEGYVPCYAYSLDILYGEYLRRHPKGVHAPQAAQAIRESLDQSLDLLSAPIGDELLDRARDCGELAERLDILRSALLASSGGERDLALASVGALRATCP
jgi:hypothetical protein